MTGTQEILWNSLSESLIITFWIFILMIGIELLVLKYKSSSSLLKTKNNFISYLVSSLSGYIPGCVGMFAMDSLYMAGLLSFGALAATMITSIGDEIVVLFSLVIKGMISLKILTILLSVLFILGITGGFLADWLVKKFKIKQSKKCNIEIHEHDKAFSLKHFFMHHIFQHILLKHIWQIAIWIFVTLTIMNFSQGYLVNFKLGELQKFYLIIIAGLIGLIPISGPGTIFFMLFANGFIPFSVLLTNCIVQDGHGMLPILGFSFKDAVKVKIFKLAFGLIIGIGLYLLKI